MRALSDYGPRATVLSGSGSVAINRVIRGIDALLPWVMFVLALDVLLVLFTGGNAVTALGITIGGARVTPPVTLLLMLVILRFPLTQRVRFSHALLSHHGVILFSVCLLLYLANGQTIATGDTIAARYLPLSILRDGNFYLDRFLGPLSLAASPPNLPWFLEFVDGHYISAYPVGAAILALRFYTPLALGGVTPESAFLADLEKLSAAVLVALSAVVLHFTLCRLTSRRMSLLITAIYALGTSSLSVSSQALWQHGPSQLALTAALYCLVRGRSEPRWMAFAGFPLAFAVITRPTDVLLALAMGAYMLFHHRRHVVGFALSGLGPVLFQLWYNVRYFGDPFRSQFPLWADELWRTPILEGLAGILLSPGRGLFIYSPIFLLSLVGIGLAWRRNGDLLLRYLSVATFVLILLYSKWSMWWGGYTYGPRLLADLTPVLALCLYPVEELLTRRRALKLVFVVLVVLSIAAHSIGALSDLSWNAAMDIDQFPERLWFWTDNQLVNRPLSRLNRAVITARRLPTSRTHPGLLSASYCVHLPSNIRATIPRRIQFSLAAANLGQAVWLVWAREEKGAVRLVWKWVTEDEKSPKMEARVPLRYVVFPGQSYEFRAALIYRASRAPMSSKWASLASIWLGFRTWGCPPSESS